MLFVTFHGDKTGINNIFGYSTKSGISLPQTQPQTEMALSVSSLPKHVKLDELRGMAIYNGNLYVVNGGKSASNVLGFQGPPKSGPEFDYLVTMIGAGQSIMHPFGIAFDPSSPNCYISNQDSNVVAQVNLAAGKHNGVTGGLGSGCQSGFLNNLYPPPDAFLDGTFAASQNGTLAGVPVDAPDVSEANGGLGVTGTGNPLAPSNSVRDVAIANGILFVCDEVDSQIDMYDLNGGAFLSSGPLSGSPTHLAISGGGLWVSAGESLYWSPLPASASGASLSFQSVAIALPAKNKIGGISFDTSGNVYVIFQDGTHTTGSGSIQMYTVTAGPPPSLSNGKSFATISQDTPEFCMWVSDSDWPS
jgi:hypothetical protein